MAKPSRKQIIKFHCSEFSIWLIFHHSICQLVNNFSVWQQKSDIYLLLIRIKMFSYLMLYSRLYHFTATFKKLSIYQFSSSLFRYFLKAKTPSVIPFWRAFLMPMKGARSKVPLSGHFKWLSQCQDWFTKSGGHARSLKLETWNFAWDHISPIHMLCKKVGLIWEHFEKLVQPNIHPFFWTFE